MWLLLADMALAASEGGDALPSGRVEGAWSYVIASYVITWGSLALYALSLYWRGRPEEA